MSIREKLIPIMLMLASLEISSQVCLASVLSTGLGFSDAGDDVLRPTASIQFITNDWITRGSVYGRDFSNVKERTFRLSRERKLKLFNYEWMKSIFGVVIQDEFTRIDVASSEDEEEIESEHNPNLGLVLGFEFDLLPQNSSFAMNFSWSSSVYLAGLGGIFLAHSKTHTMLLGIGGSLDSLF